MGRCQVGFPNKGLCILAKSSVGIANLPSVQLCLHSAHVSFRKLFFKFFGYCDIRHSVSSSAGAKPPTRSIRCHAFCTCALIFVPSTAREFSRLIMRQQVSCARSPGLSLYLFSHLSFSKSKSTDLCFDAGGNDISSESKRDIGVQLAVTITYSNSCTRGQWCIIAHDSSGPTEAQIRYTIQVKYCALHSGLSFSCFTSFSYG